MLSPSVAFHIIFILYIFSISLPGRELLRAGRNPRPFKSKNREQWAKDAKGTKDVQNTIGLCLRHASTVTDAEALAVKQTWDKVFLEIPERVEDLRADLVPAFLRPQRNVPVIEHVIQNLGTGPELDELIALNANWGFKIFDRMQNPAIKEHFLEVMKSGKF